MVGQPAEAEQDEDDDEHLGHFPHLFLGSSVVLLSNRGLPLQPPQGPAEVAVGAGQTHQGQDVGDQLEE